MTTRLRPRAALAALVAGATSLGWSATALGAIQTPPPAGVLMTVGVNDSFISVEGLPAPLLPGDVHAEVWRGGVLVAVTGAATPVGGLVQFNHDPGDCFSDLTPDLLPGDHVRIVDHAVPANGYATTVRALTAGSPVQTGPGTAVMQGTAATASGAPLPLGELEAFVRTATVPQPLNLFGTLAYTPAGSTSWTATFAGLSAQDLADVVAAPRVEFSWVRPTEAQIFAVGAPPGPSANCTAAPRLQPPGTPDLVAPDDSGASSADNVTSVTQPTFQGVAVPPADPDAGPSVTLVDTASGTPVPIGGPVPLEADGSYSIAPDAPLTPGTHEIRVVQSLLGEDAVPSGLVSVNIDTQIAAPVFTGSTPASGADRNAPALSGTAEAGSTVTIHTDASCASPATASGSTAAFAGSGIAVNVPDNSTTSFYVRAIDVAGNVSICAGPLVYQEITPTAGSGTGAAPQPVTTATHLVTTRAPGPGSVGPFTLLTRRVRVTRGSEVLLRLTCRGLSTELCVGRIQLRARVPGPRSGGSGRVETIGRKSFAVRGGRETTVAVPLNRLGRALLSTARPRGVRVTAQVVVRQGTVTARRAGIPVTLVPFRSGRR